MPVCSSYFLKIVKRFSLSIAAKANRVRSFQFFSEVSFLKLGQSSEFQVCFLTLLSTDRAGQVRARSATGTNTPISNSIDHGLNHERMSAYSPASNPTPDGFFSSDTLSVSSSTNSLQSLDSHRKSCSEIATQTDDLLLSPDGTIPSNIPGPLRKKLATVLGSPSKIPRPVMQRSKTMELPSSKLKRRNSTNSHDRERSSQRAPRMQREKSQPNIRREKSDLGQQSKYKMVQSPGPKRRGELIEKLF